MPGEVLPATIREFISQHLCSVEQLEILLLFVNQPETDWTAHSVFKVVQSSLASVEQGLKKFTAAGLITKSPMVDFPSFRYAAPGEQRQALDDISRFYKEMPVRVIEAIYQQRSNTVQGFADAFKFKRDP